MPTIINDILNFLKNPFIIISLIVFLLLILLLFYFLKTNRHIEKILTYKASDKINENQYLVVFDMPKKLVSMYREHGVETRLVMPFADLEYLILDIADYRKFDKYISSCLGSNKGLNVFIKILDPRDSLLKNVILEFLNYSRDNGLIYSKMSFIDRQPSNLVFNTKLKIFTQKTFLNVLKKKLHVSKATGGAIYVIRFKDYLQRKGKDNGAYDLFESYLAELILNLETGRFFGLTSNDDLIYYKENIFNKEEALKEFERLMGYDKSDKSLLKDANIKVVIGIIDGSIGDVYSSFEVLQRDISRFINEKATNHYLYNYFDFTQGSYRDIVNTDITNLHNYLDNLKIEYRFFPIVHVKTAVLYSYYVDYAKSNDKLEYLSFLQLAKKYNREDLFFKRTLENLSASLKATSGKRYRFLINISLDELPYYNHFFEDNVEKLRLILIIQYSEFINCNVQQFTQLQRSLDDKGILVAVQADVKLATYKFDLLDNVSQIILDADLVEAIQINYSKQLILNNIQENLASGVKKNYICLYADSSELIAYLINKEIDNIGGNYLIPNPISSIDDTGYLQNRRIKRFMGDE
ncbi:MAG: hypothetical protein LBM99_05720 [Bacillales bacterium]|jgi:hypothetical protein|nr:hypothetical protein [Bacillales bacterium]